MTMSTDPILEIAPDKQTKEPFDKRFRVRPGKTGASNSVMARKLDEIKKKVVMFVLSTSISESQKFPLEAIAIHAKQTPIAPIKDLLFLFTILIF